MGLSAGPSGDFILRGYRGLDHRSELDRYDASGHFVEQVMFVSVAFGDGLGFAAMDRLGDVLWSQDEQYFQPQYAWSFHRTGMGPINVGSAYPQTRVGVSFMATDAAGYTRVGVTISGSGSWDFGQGPETGRRILEYAPSGWYVGSIPDPGVSQVDAAGNLYLSKTFQGTTDVGCGPVSSGAGQSTLFAKLDPDGACLWSKAFAVTSSQFTVDPAGDVLIEAGFTGTVSFGGAPLASAGTMDVALAKLDPAGNHLWSRSFGGTGASLPMDAYPNVVELATDDAGSLVLHGRFTGTIDFGAGPVASGSSPMSFILALDPNGTLGWVRTFVSSVPIHVAAAADGRVIVAGQAPSIDLGCGTVDGYPPILELSP